MIEGLKEALSTILKFVGTAPGEYIFRCPFCGDSKSNPNKGHLYVNQDNGTYHCAKCGSSGHSRKLLSNNNISFDFPIVDSYKKSKTKKHNKVDVEFTITDSQENYLKTRLGDIDIDPIVAKIITPEELKKLYKMSSKSNVNRYISLDCVSFLTYFNKKIICRNFKGDMRYNVLALEDGSDCYVINNKRDPYNYRKHKTVVIGEGIFDVLNTYYNLDLFPKDSVYVAALNAYYKTPFNIGRIESQCLDPNLVILADSDKTDDDYLRSIRAINFRYTIYRNRLGKDFGEREVEPYISRKGVYR